MRTVFLDAEGLEDRDLSGLRDQCTSLQVYQNSSPDSVASRVREAQVVIVNKVKLGREAFAAADKLEMICVVATGVDIIDLQAAREHNITVCNCQAYGTSSVVQYVFSAILALQTNIHRYDHAVRQGRWQKATQFCFLDYPIVELKGKTMGILGYGTLGKGVAEVAEAFGMNVVVAARPGTSSEVRPTLEQMLPMVDILTLHCPLTDLTRGIIGEKQLGLMKPSAFLINAARGGIVDEAALAKALRAGRLAGAAVDVLTAEPPQDGNVLLDATIPHLIITPHIAWASDEARQKIIDQTVENLQAYKAGDPVRVVNPAN